MRFSRKFWFLLLLFYVSVFICGLGVKFLYYEWWPTYEFRATIAHIGACSREEDGVQCTRPFVKKLLQQSDGAILMTEFSRDFKPMWCHYVGHVVGQEVLEKYGDVEEAISRCNRSCDSACVHGIIGAAFAREVGVEYEDLDLAHLSADELKVIGKRLCTNIGTCHGVGHSLFQIYGEFQPAFAVCEEVPGPMRAQCYNGVTMEYADILSSRGMNSPLGIEYPEPDSLASLCILPSLTQTRSCFRYFPRMAYMTLQRYGFSETQSLNFVRTVCQSFKVTSQRIACFSGIGSNGSYLVLTDTAAAVKSCEWLGSEQAEAACIVGKIGVATEDRMKRLASYCDAMVNVTMEDICYQSLFFFLNRVGIPVERITTLCREGDTVCLQSLENMLVEPLIKVQALPNTP